MTDAEETERALDAAVREHAAPNVLDDGEIITAWVCVAGTKDHTGNGTTILMAPQTASKWEVRGMLHDAIKALDDDSPHEEETDD